MCLAVPMKLVEIESDNRAMAELDGGRQVVDVSLIESPATGDYVIVHAGFAIERLDPAEADARLDWFEQLAAGVRVAP
jgi:hydrogenase expression/formation protein HypC